MTADPGVTETAHHAGLVSVTRCEVCDARLRRGRVRYCSQPCEIAGRHGPALRCRTCGTPLIRKFSGAASFGPWVQRYRKGAAYCSSACRQKAYRQRTASAS